MILRGVPYSHFNIKNQDTLGEDPFGTDTRYRIQVANPPYSAHWDPTQETEQDPRFSMYGKLAPASKADFAFLQHMVHHMDDDGRIACLLPHGALFRGGAEETIRKYLIENINVIDAIIGLPANLFYGTGIPVCIIVCKRNRNGNSGDILFIDASKNFEPGKNQNVLTDENIQAIADAYKARKDVDKFAHVAAMEEIRSNNYNLNIPRYVDTFEKEAEIDINAETAKLKALTLRAQAVEYKVNQYFEELGLEV